MSFLHPNAKLQKISLRKKQLWVVAYVNQHGQTGELAPPHPIPQQKLIEQAYADIEASQAGGADAVVLINEWCSLAELEATVAACRSRYPQAALGVNYLGDLSEPYGYRESFRLAQKYRLQIVWTDFSGVDLIHERQPVDLQEIQRLRPPDVFYGSGVHMKYSTLRQPDKPIEASALQAMGWVDGVIVTGLKTGAACDPENAWRARAAIGPYPLGVASGVAPENAHTIREAIDFFLVGSSLQDAEKRIVTTRVRALRDALGDELRN